MRSGINSVMSRVPPMLKRYAKYMTEAQQRIVDHSEALLKKKLGNTL